MELRGRPVIVAGRRLPRGAVGDLWGVVIKVGYADFTTVTRSRTAHQPLDVAGHVYRTAVELLDRLTAEHRVAGAAWLPPISLLGVAGRRVGHRRRAVPAAQPG